MKQTVKVQEVIILYVDYVLLPDPVDIVRCKIAPPRKQVVNVAIMPDDYHFTDSFYESVKDIVSDFDQNIYYYFDESEWKEIKNQVNTRNELVGFGDNNFILELVGKPEKVDIEYMEVA